MNPAPITKRQMYPNGVLDNLLSTPALIASEYLIQVLVTDGTTSYVLRPGNAADASYEAVNITANPKLANFYWVPNQTVTRNASYMQNRPTGVERWNMMPCELTDLRFTKAYEAPDRLSEFIGIRGTTKYSTDEELIEIYNLAHAEYLKRKRDGATWQTMHSVVYGANGIEHLWVQEDFSRDLGRSTAVDIDAIVAEVERRTAATDEEVEDAFRELVDDTLGVGMYDNPEQFSAAEQAYRQVFGSVGLAYFIEENSALRFSNPTSYISLSNQQVTLHRNDLATCKAAFEAARGSAEWTQFVARHQAYYDYEPMKFIELAYREIGENNGE